MCGKIDSLVIDHRDNNPRNKDPTNLRLLCRSCNVKAAFPRVRERKIIRIDSTEDVRRHVDYQSGSAEMQVNDFCETEYRNWVMAHIRLNGSITKKEAINAGAERVGANPTTTRKYLDKLTSTEGHLKEFKNQSKERVITFRIRPNDEDPEEIA